VAHLQRMACEGLGHTSCADDADVHGDVLSPVHVFIQWSRSSPVAQRARWLCGSPAYGVCKSTLVQLGIVGHFTSLGLFCRGAIARMRPDINYRRICIETESEGPNSRQLPKHRHTWSAPPCAGRDRRWDTPNRRGRRYGATSGSPERWCGYRAAELNADKPDAADCGLRTSETVANRVRLSRTCGRRRTDQLWCRFPSFCLKKGRVSRHSPYAHHTRV